MHRFLRYSLYGITGAVAFTVMTLGGFRAAAMLRETIPPGTQAPAPGRFVKVGDLTLHYREWGPAGGRPVLLIHGTMAWAGTWYDLAERLAARGYRVIAPDLPPFGYSQRPRPADYSRAAQSKRILGFADALGLENIVLTGHSFGGGATMEAAFTAPGRIDGLVLLDVALGLANPGARPPAEALLSLKPLRDMIVSATFTNPMMIGKGLRDFIHDDAVVTDDRIAIYARPLRLDGTTQAVGQWFMTGLYGDERASRAADRDAYRRFDRPTLIVWGREDTVTPLAQGEEIHALLPNSRLEVLPAVNHIPHVENPDAVAAAMLGFIEDLPRGTGTKADVAGQSAWSAADAPRLRGTLR